MKNTLILFVVALLNLSCSSQKIIPIVQSNRYSAEVSSQSEHYYFFAQYYIDPEKKDIIDLENLKKGVNRVIKDVNYSGYIILDIENKVYKELKKETINHKNYKENISMFVEMVEMVKVLRPKAKVGVYGFPFNFHSASQKKQNNFEKLKPLLKTVDFFAPQIYLYYTTKERSQDFFDNYITDNLSLHFEYAGKLNKKVYPFVWYKIHPYNKKYGGNIIEPNLYSTYVNNIKNFRYQGKRVEKVIYWEPSKKTIDIDKKIKETINLFK